MLKVISSFKKAYLELGSKKYHSTSGGRPIVFVPGNIFFYNNAVQTINLYWLYVEWSSTLT